MTDLPEPVRVNGEYEYAYTATQMREYRNQALEEAAKVCDSLIHYGEVSGVLCAKQIRALKELK